MKILNWIKENKILVSIVLFGAILRLYKLDYQSIWIDEICSFKEANPTMSAIDIYKFVKDFDPHPPFYYISLHYIFLIFGYTTFVMRAYSAFLGIAGLIAFYFLGKEISNKKVGLIGTGLLAINFFHIYYSQEARMYSLMFLTTTLSFYTLIKFIKTPTIRNTVPYIICTTLMIYSHFFALFVLFSQAVIILYFLIEKEKIERKRFFILSLISGLVVIILWIPALLIFLQASKTQSSWIPEPTPEQFSSLFKEFFGNAEVLFYFVSILLLFYFFKTFNKKGKSENPKDESKNVFQFAFISIWVFISLLIPYVISYIKIPVMVNRYFISILPAVIILIALGFNQIKDNKIRNIIIALFIISSLTDIFIVKDYYNKITKTQFREITNDIILKNKSNSLIVSTWAWHLETFLSQHKMITHQSDLQQYINGLMVDPSKKEDFWIVGAHFQQYQLSPEAEAFLSTNFNKIEAIEHYDTWARYYVSKAGIENTYVLKINEFEPIKTDNDINILLFSNSTTYSKPIELTPGEYRLVIKAKSLPEIPLNNENAHLTIFLNDKKIGAYFISEKEETLNYTSFKIDKNQNYQIGITFDNDLVLDNYDRNALIFSTIIEKVSK